jgi:SAM-dependent methyltransferase
MRGEFVGIVGGTLGYKLLRYMVRVSPGNELTTAYDGRSKMEQLFGPNIWNELANKTVVDFGCATGAESVEIAQHTNAEITGLDIREDALTKARQRAKDAGVANRVRFATEIKEKVDVIISLDAFEHFAEPLAMLRLMRGLLKDDGCVIACFGPTWYHPLGGHGFSVFPFAHLLFTENVLMRWYRETSASEARRFGEVRGGLNQMTIGRFERIIAQSDFEFEKLEAVPIRKLRPIANKLTREFTTSVVRCKLVPKS